MREFTKMMLRQIVGLRSLIEELLTPWTEERTEEKKKKTGCEQSSLFRPQLWNKHHGRNLRRAIRTHVEEMGCLFFYSFLRIGVSQYKL